MNRNRMINNFLLGSSIFLLMFSASGCMARQEDNQVMAFGSKVGALARTIQSETLFIQKELARPQPNVHDMQEAQAKIRAAHLEQLPPAPEELSNLHDLWIEASFDCQNSTNLAVINLGGDLTPCLSKIDEIVKATEEYMPPQLTP